MEIFPRNPDLRKNIKIFPLNSNLTKNIKISLWDSVLKKNINIFSRGFVLLQNGDISCEHWFWWKLSKLYNTIQNLIKRAKIERHNHVNFYYTNLEHANKDNATGKVFLSHSHPWEQRIVAFTIFLTIFSCFLYI